MDDDLKKIHIDDQIAAASREARDRILRIAEERGVNWYTHFAEVEPDQLLWGNRMLQARVRTFPICPHLLTVPQPGIALLALSVVLCDSCVNDVREHDGFGYDWALKVSQHHAGPRECDLCMLDDVKRFAPLMAHIGPFVISGDVCLDCFDQVIRPHLPSA